MSNGHRDETANLIAGLHPDFAPYALQFVNAARSAGVPLVIISGTRSTPAADPEGNVAIHSLHLAGLAFDVQVIGYKRNQLPDWFWQVLGEYWESMGGRWGGRFGIPDVNHFDAGVVTL